jgi:hypothetical protein
MTSQKPIGLGLTIGELELAKILGGLLEDNSND